jgi:hypothetical protein
MEAIRVWDKGVAAFWLVAVLGALGLGCEASLSVPLLEHAPGRPCSSTVTEAPAASAAKGSQATPLPLPGTPAGNPARLPGSEVGTDGLVRAVYTAPLPRGAGADSRGTAASAEGPTHPLPSTAGTSATESARVAPPAPPAITTLASASPGVALRLSNSPRIVFHFEVKDPGTAGPVAVEVWGTRDLKTWAKYDAVARKGNAYTIEVKEEGLYGFTLLARTAEGGKDRPRPGEAPQVWVVVDTTRPEVQFLGAELNILAQAPALVIRWAASDRNLGPRPVTLLHAERAEGPWTLLAGQVENTGRYEWQLPATLPPSLYLRVQVEDLMGNVGQAQTPNLLHKVRKPPVAAIPAAGSGPKPGAAPLVHAAEMLPPPPPTPGPDLPRAPSPTAEPVRAAITVVSVEAERN